MIAAKYTDRQAGHIGHKSSDFLAMPLINQDQTSPLLAVFGNGTIVLPLQIGKLGLHSWARTPGKFRVDNNNVKTTAKNEFILQGSWIWKKEKKLEKAPLFRKWYTRRKNAFQWTKDRNPFENIFHYFVFLTSEVPIHFEVQVTGEMSCSVLIWIFGHMFGFLMWRPRQYTVSEVVSWLAL